MNFLEIETFQQFSNYFGYRSSILSFQLYNLDRSFFYRTFEISKSNGSIRVINAPKGIIKKLQENINLELSKIYKPTSIAKGFYKGSSIVDNAKAHIGKKWIVNLDIKDFFSTITFPRIYGIFKAKPFEFNHKIAGLIANICTYNGVLPQGSPTSPVLSNMIAFKLDRRLIYYTRSNNIDITRYADDITFSSNNYQELNLIVENGLIKKDLNNIFIKNGFLINDNKTRIRYYYNHQEVTGIKVNKKLNIQKFMKYKIRSILHALEKYGEANTYLEYKRRNNIADTDQTGKELRLYVEGLLAYVKMILGKDASFFIKSANRYNNAIQENKIITLNSSSKHIDNAVFVIEANLRQGTCFSNQDCYIFTCLHNIIDINELKKIKASDQEMTLLIEMKTMKIRIYNKFVKHNLDKFTIEYFSIDEDFIIIKDKEFYSQYYLLVDNDKIDRRYNHIVIGYPDSENKNPVIIDDNVKFLRAREHGNVVMYPINSKIVQGMSGAPILKQNSNIVVGFVCINIL